MISNSLIDEDKYSETPLKILMESLDVVASHGTGGRVRLEIADEEGREYSNGRRCCWLHKSIFLVMVIRKSCFCRASK